MVNGTKTWLAYLLERNEFKASQKRSTDEIIGSFESLGATIVSTCDRDFIMYNAETLRENVPQLLEILGESLLNPVFDPADMEDILPVIQAEISEKRLKPLDYMQELVTEAGFSTDPLGRSQFGSWGNIPNLKKDDLVEYFQKTMVPPRMVLVGASVNHQRFVELASQQFSRCPPAEFVRPKAVYTGGTLLHEHYCPEGLVYYGIALNCDGWLSGDGPKIALLQRILGGGQSFSAGGPGKGMFSRLNTSVLNSDENIRSAECIAALHGDTGIFGIAGSCLPKSLLTLQDKLFHQFTTFLTTDLSEAELSRAKAQLKSSIFYNLEQRSILWEDVGRQVSIFGHREPAYVSCQKIDAITDLDIKRVVSKMLEKPPSIVVLGPPKILSSVPRHDITTAYLRQVSRL